MEQKLFYAASTGGFYASDIHDAIPVDAVEITAEQHAALLQAQSEGKQIVAGNDGYPVAVVPAPPAAIVPESVQAWQAKTALLDAGLYDDVLAIMGNPATDRKIVIAWEGAPNFRRDSPMISALSDMLGLTSEQLDQLFFAAAAV